MHIFQYSHCAALTYNIVHNVLTHPQMLKGVLPCNNSAVRSQTVSEPHREQPCL